MPVTEIEKQTQEVLALAWALFNRPLWEARNEMQFYLEARFCLKVEGATGVIDNRTETNRKIQRYER